MSNSFGYIDIILLGMIAGFIIRSAQSSTNQVIFYPPPHIWPKKWRNLWHKEKSQFSSIFYIFGSNIQCFHFYKFEMMVSGGIWNILECFSTAESTFLDQFCEKNKSKQLVKEISTELDYWSKNTIFLQNWSRKVLSALEKSSKMVQSSPEIFISSL